MTASNEQLYSTLATIFENALGLQPNFFLQQNIPSTGVGDKTPFGRIWIEEDYANNGFTPAITTRDNPDGVSVDQTYECPMTMKILVHFYRAGASDLARALTQCVWDAEPIQAFVDAGMAFVSVSSKQNVSTVINETWEEHSIVRLTVDMIDTRVVTRPALSGPPDITVTVQGLPSATITGAP